MQRSDIFSPLRRQLSQHYQSQSCMFVLNCQGMPGRKLDEKIRTILFLLANPITDSQLIFWWKVNTYHPPHRGESPLAAHLEGSANKHLPTTTTPPGKLHPIAVCYHIGLYYFFLCNSSASISSGLRVARLAVINSAQTHNHFMLRVSWICFVWSRHNVTVCIWHDNHYHYFLTSFQFHSLKLEGCHGPDLTED